LKQFARIMKVSRTGGEFGSPAQELSSVCCN
jgi:hypothetical protein